MAADAQLILHFAAGEPIEVIETPDQIRNLIDGVTSRHVALIEVTDTAGSTHWINVSQIVRYHAPGKPSTVGFT